MTTFAIINPTQTQNPEIRIYLNPNADDIDSITEALTEGFEILDPDDKRVVSLISHEKRNNPNFNENSSRAIFSDVILGGLTSTTDESDEVTIVPPPSKVSHTKDDIIALFALDHRYVDAAIKIIGDNQTADELADGTADEHNGVGFSAAYARTGKNLWTWVTGVDPKTNESRWAPKSIAHEKSDYEFRKYISAYGAANAVEFAEMIVGNHWRQLGALTDANYQLPSLPLKNPKPKFTSNKPPVMYQLTGAVIKDTREKATQIVWDGRLHWLPNSQISIKPGYIELPEWMAKKKGFMN